LLREAAKHLDDGDEAAAVPCLAGYVEANPAHAVIRTHLAELLIKQKRDGEARVQLERYVADAQEQGEPATRHLVHAHTRLVEIAERDGDAYAEHLNRGVGLFRLVEQMLADPETARDESAQAMLFKAIEELKLAAKEKADEARPHWYLSEAWSHLGQSQPASASLRRAKKLAILGGLTPAESQALAMSR
jgi:predicted Zn-dependent protease